MRSGMPFYTLLIHRKRSPRRFRRKLASRFATCSLTREGFCKSRFWAIDGSAFCNRNNHYHLSGGYTASSPQGEPLSIIALKMGHRGADPYGRDIFFVSAIDGCAFCDRGDLGRIISSPTILLFIFLFSSFVIHFYICRGGY